MDAVEFNYFEFYLNVSLYVDESSQKTTLPIEAKSFSISGWFTTIGKLKKKIVLLIQKVSLITGNIIPPFYA